jgi:hypothetical protein
MVSWTELGVVEKEHTANIPVRPDFLNPGG